MKRTVTAMEARKKFGELLEGVHHKGDEIVIERAGKVMGVVIPEWEYRSIERAREKLWGIVEAIWEANKDVTSEEIEKAVAEAMAEVRGGSPDRYQSS